MNRVTLDQTIGEFYGQRDRHPDSRYRSWEYCYGFFRQHRADLLGVQDDAALQLGFYLASWGMYRGSSALLQRAYTAHLPVIHVLASPRFSNLWRDVGARDGDVELGPSIMALVALVTDAYEGFVPTDTLVTKILLGTVGCLPARDRFFEKGLKEQGLVYGGLNRGFVDRMIGFCIENRPKLTEWQHKIIGLGGPCYPLMKLVDMHFWQVGFDREST